MAFKRVDKDTLPPRRWALKGYYGDGKSTFILAMHQPTLMIDADGRRHELKGSELYELSEEPSDHRSVERIQDILDKNMPGSGIRTIAIDSVTSLIGTSIARAMLDNAADRNKNKNQAWVDKAERMRLLQDAVTAHGSHVLWIWHLEDAQLNGVAQIRETLPETERERLFRSLNASLRIVREKDRRGVLVEWSREGPAGMVIWDEEGLWKGVPERIEAAIYGRGGGTKPTPPKPAASQGAGSGPILEEAPRAAAKAAAHPAAPAATGQAADNVLTFYSPTEAVSWGVDQGAFPDAAAAQAAYDQLKGEVGPRNAKEMYAAWIDFVSNRKPRRRRA
ncbi:ATP-binding protein [Skermanella rosea]|uniref:AAA family ATPase n=1 Tax=Skermanella rosea TaxID=1817965 RepID=UPI001933E72A|nr:AAA family ATPase [Skermanella rosea]UEM02581.1 ATP-binding protein [Skermanella rosea]